MTSVPVSGVHITSACKAHVSWNLRDHNTFDSGFDLSGPMDATITSQGPNAATAMTQPEGSAPLPDTPPGRSQAPAFNGADPVTIPVSQVGRPGPNLSLASSEPMYSAFQHHSMTGNNSMGQIPGMQMYPIALASHDEVCANLNLFNHTLKELHTSLGQKVSKLMKLGGQELNLHVLYQRVTAAGGAEAVIREKQWRDVGDIFNLPPTITSVSFVLKRGYMTFLWDYEQVYFCGKGGQPREAAPSGRPPKGHVTLLPNNPFAPIVTNMPHYSPLDQRNSALDQKDWAAALAAMSDSAQNGWPGQHEAAQQQNGQAPTTPHTWNNNPGTKSPDIVPNIPTQTAAANAASWNTLVTSVAQSAPMSLIPSCLPTTVETGLAPARSGLDVEQIRRAREEATNAMEILGMASRATSTLGSDVMTSQGEPGPAGRTRSGTLTAVTQAPGLPDPKLVGTKALATITAAFEHGYFVTVQVAGVSFSGMLAFPTTATPSPTTTLPRTSSDLHNGTLRTLSSQRLDGTDQSRQFSPSASLPPTTPTNPFPHNSAKRARNAGLPEKEAPELQMNPPNQPETILSMLLKHSSTVGAGELDECDVVAHAANLWQDMDPVARGCVETAVQADEQRYLAEKAVYDRHMEASGAKMLAAEAAIEADQAMVKSELLSAATYSSDSLSRQVSGAPSASASTVNLNPVNPVTSFQHTLPSIRLHSSVSPPHPSKQTTSPLEPGEQAHLTIQALNGPRILDAHHSGAAGPATRNRFLPQALQNRFPYGFPPPAPANSPTVPAKGPPNLPRAPSSDRTTTGPVEHSDTQPLQFSLQEHSDFASQIQQSAETDNPSPAPFMTENADCIPTSTPQMLPHHSADCTQQIPTATSNAPEATTFSRIDNPFGWLSLHPSHPRRDVCGPWHGPRATPNAVLREFDPSRHMAYKRVSIDAGLDEHPFKVLQKDPKPLAFATAMLGHPPKPDTHAPAPQPFSEEHEMFNDSQELLADIDAGFDQSTVSFLDDLMGHDEFWPEKQDHAEPMQELDHYQ